MKEIKVGIIGGTKGMGHWFAGLLKNEGCRVLISGRKTALGINELAKLCNVIVVAVPISATVDVIRQVGPLLSQDKLLMDLTSLKKEPVKVSANPFLIEDKEHLIKLFIGQPSGTSKNFFKQFHIF